MGDDVLYYTDLIDAGDISTLMDSCKRERSVSDKIVAFFFSSQVPGPFSIKGKTVSRMHLLHYAMIMAKPEIAHFFLLHGADPNQTMAGDWTGLHLAAFLGHVDYVEPLLFFRAKVDLPDKFGLTPLHIAIQGGEIEVVQCLLRSRANVKDSPVALNLAVCHGHGEIVRLLMTYGANPEMRNRLGKTSFDLLQRPEQNDIEEIMRTVKEVERSRDRISLILEGPPVTTLSDLLDRLPPAPQRRPTPEFKVTRLS
jgi:ankyrin repeat protein